MRENRVQVNFSSGEVVDEGYDRADSQIFGRAVKALRNGIITPLGQIRRRPGFGFQVDLTTSVAIANPEQARGEAYVFSSSQFYALVFEPGKCHILSVNGTLIQTLSGAPLTGITAARLWQFHYCYRGDSIILTHEAFWPIEIKRTSATTFTATNFPFYKGDALTAWQTTSADPSYRYAPFYANYAPRTSPRGGVVQLTVSAATGAVTLTASAAYWDPLHVGAIIGLDGVAATGDYDYMARFTEGAVITSYVSSTVVNATILGTGNIGDLTQNNMQWAELMWNDLRGYPRTAFFHEQRLFFAGSRAHPNGIWGSASSAFSDQGKGDGAYYDFAWMDWTGSPNVPVETQALLLFLADDQVLDIRRVFSYRNLHLMTSTAEFIVPSSLTDTAITPFNFRARKQTPYGVDDQVCPVVYDDAVVFLERNRSVLREVVYNDLQKAYGAQSLSNLAPHRISNLEDDGTQTTPVQMCLWKGSVTTPEAMLLIVLSNGKISVMQGNRGNDTLGWHHWTTPGYFRSIFTIDSYVFALVQREVAGVDRLYLERMDEASTLDCMLEFTLGTPADQIPGQARLAGNTAAIVVPQLVTVKEENGRSASRTLFVHAGDAAPVAGVLDSPIILTEGHTGLDYGFELDMLSPAPMARNGILLAQPKRVGRIGVGVKDCTSLTVDGQDRGPYRRHMLPVDLPHAISGNIPAMGSSHGYRLATKIEQRRPGKLVILSVSRDVVF